MLNRCHSFPTVHDFHGATTGPSTPAGIREEELDAEIRRAGASLADLSLQAAPAFDSRPKSSGTTPLTGPQPAHEQRTQGLGKPQVSAEKRNYFRFVCILGLSAETRLADILEGIAQTAPVGRVLHVHWEKDEVAIRRKSKSKAAFVLFDHDVAAADLVRLAKQRVFLVRGKTPHVSIWDKRPFNSNFTGEDASRVLHIRGPRDVEGFSVEGIRDLLLGNDRIVKALGPLGLDAETIVTKQIGGGRQLIEWRFFSNDKQARPVLFLLRRLFYKSLSIDFGPDPCWNEELYPRVCKGTRRLPVIREPFKWPSVRRQELTSSDEDTHDSPERNVARPAFEPYQMSSEDLQKDATHGIQLLEKLLGHDKAPLTTLGERQYERIAAWTQTSQSAKTDAQHGHEYDDNQKKQCNKII
ncbi:hypothetical protein N0V82_006301 [Gnomoniopsis sp. IMI 355080]|nr:hypothetical protein N0V82_006301 [Gnomoniopsis sp. IMI 355080]